MNVQRFVVSDSLWQRLEPHLPGEMCDAGVTAKDNRLFLEAERKPGRIMLLLESFPILASTRQNSGIR